MQAMKNQTTANAPQKIYLKDYTPPVFAVDKVDLTIRLFDDKTWVNSELVMTKKHEGELVLFGRKLALKQVAVNGASLSEDQYRLDDETLTLLVDCAVGETLTVATEVVIYPNSNSELEGLYLAGEGDEAMYVTQCEAEGFRKITFYPDRPDVLSVFTTRIEADKKFKTLLGNGNLTQAGDLDNHRHFAVWHDPIPKPSYLFACVVADLAVLQDQFVTSEGREVLLEIYADSNDIDKCDVAMQALKDSMTWDEQNYGRAYDLDRYMIVATGKFNMGAMENKGLNIFNTAYVLSSPETATDEANFGVKAVIAHEYFHNWTGNRITCRDWFQLCLKEGLTVFRDQSFSGDFRSPAVQRIDDVATLRAAQFSEDAGALAHPVRPDSFVEINNFYTATVYEKGAEIVRMMANLLGKDKYRLGMDEYFRRYDGQAVTLEDFIDALATQDERIYQFLQWYKQPGTPTLTGNYHVNDQGVRLNFEQQIRKVSGYDDPKPLPIPIDTAIFDANTGELLAQQLLLLQSDKDSFDVAVDLAGKTPLVSVLRGFSAPVVLNFDYSNDDLVSLAKFETDGFNRWQAMGALIKRYLDNRFDDADQIADVLRYTTNELLSDEPMLAARLFDIPSEKELGAMIDSDYDPAAIKARRKQLKLALASRLKDDLDAWYQALPLMDYEDTPTAVGRRALRNVVLELLAWADKDTAHRYAVAQYDNATCMSERLGALKVLVHHQLADNERYLADFYERFSDEDLVIDEWFEVQASSDMSTAAIKKLMTHADFDWQNPNRVRSILSALPRRPVWLWSDEGVDVYLAALVKLDAINPQLTARLLGALGRWYTLKDTQKAKAHAKLTAFKEQVHSKNTLEICNQLLSVD